MQTNRVVRRMVCRGTPDNRGSGRWVSAWASGIRPLAAASSASTAALSRRARAVHVRLYRTAAALTAQACIESICSELVSFIWSLPCPGIGIKLGISLGGGAMEGSARIRYSAWCYRKMNRSGRWPRKYGANHLGHLSVCNATWHSSPLAWCWLGMRHLFGVMPASQVLLPCNYGGSRQTSSSGTHSLSNAA